MGRYRIEASNVSRCHCRKDSDGISCATLASHLAQDTRGLSSGVLVRDFI